MPGVDGIEATRRILAATDGVARGRADVVLGPRRILEALDAGAIGYLLKDAEPDELFRGVRAAARASRRWRRRRPRRCSARARTGRTADLSEREREVLELDRRGPAEQADRPPARDQREDGQGPPHQHLPGDRRDHRTEAALWATEHGLGRRD